MSDILVVDWIIGWFGLRFEEGVHLVRPVDLHLRDILLRRGEADCEVFGVVVVFC